MRLFLDEGAPMLALLRDAAEHDATGEASRGAAAGLLEQAQPPVEEPRGAAVLWPTR